MLDYFIVANYNFLRNDGHDGHEWLIAYFGFKLKQDSSSLVSQSQSIDKPFP